MSTEPKKYPIPSVCCVVYDPTAGEILLIRKCAHKYEGGSWSCPGGKQEYSETSNDAAWRELREECGPGLNPATLCKAGVLGFVEDLALSIDKHYLTVVHLFIAGGRPDVINAEPENHTAVGWFRPDGLPRRVTAGFLQVIELLRGGGCMIGHDHFLADKDWRRVGHG